MEKIDPVAFAEKLLSQAVENDRRRGKTNSSISADEVVLKNEFNDVISECSIFESENSTEQVLTFGCESCEGSGVQVFGEDGKTKAKRCSCSTNIEWPLAAKLDSLINSFSQSGIPALYANASYKGKRFEEVAPPHLLDWLDKACLSNPGENFRSMLYFCGGVGNGKTHLASDCCKYFLLRTGKPVRFLQAEDIVDAKKNADLYGDRKHRESKQKLDYQKQVLAEAGLVIIDDIGRTKLSQWTSAIFDELFDIRYRANLPTILISNHTFQSDTSLRRKSIDKILGERALDRLKESLVIEFDSPSMRGNQNSDELNRRGKLFKFKTPIMEKKEGELQVLNWITRNPVFEPIVDRDRVYVKDSLGNIVTENGQPLDAARTQPKICNDVWQKGDRLSVEGPVLSLDDAKTYFYALEGLRIEHYKKRLGLDLKIPISDFLKLMGKTDTGDNRAALLKSTSRITRAPLSYTDNLGRRWSGALFTSLYEPNGPDGAFMILSFNSSMITFYEADQYTRFDSKLFEAKIGTDGLKMQLFLRSHNNDKDRFDILDFDGWMKFLEKPVEKMDSSQEGKKLRRYHRRKFSELLNKQIEAKLLDKGSHLSRGNGVTLKIVDEKS